MYIFLISILQCFRLFIIADDELKLLDVYIFNRFSYFYLVPIYVFALLISTLIAEFTFSQ